MCYGIVQQISAPTCQSKPEIPVLGYKAAKAAEHCSGVGRLLFWDVLEVAVCQEESLISLYLLNGIQCMEECIKIHGKATHAYFPKYSIEELTLD